MTSLIPRQRLHFIGALGVVIALWRTPVFLKKMIRLQLAYQLLPLLALWFLLGRISFALQDTLATRGPQDWTFWELLEQFTPLVLWAGGGLLVLSILSLLGFIRSANYALSFLGAAAGTRTHHVSLLRPVLATVFGAIIVIILQLFIVSILPGPLLMLAPLLALYAFSTLMIIPLLTQDRSFSLFSATLKAMSLSYVSTGQSKIACAFTLLNLSILFYFALMMGYLLGERTLEWALIGPLSHSVTDLEWLGLSMSNFALIGKVTEGLFFGAGMMFLSSSAAIVYAWAKQEMPLMIPDEPSE